MEQSEMNKMAAPDEKDKPQQPQRQVNPGPPGVTNPGGGPGSQPPAPSKEGPAEGGGVDSMNPKDPRPGAGHGTIRNA